MTVIEQTAPQSTPIPGVAHATWAGRDDGLTQLSLWRQRIDAGGATPPHRHGCDEVVLCLAGEGEVHVDGTVHRFAAGRTVVLPKDRDHQLFNTGAGPLELIGVFAATPVPTVLSDGSPLELPWRS